ncbi:hypothetical protein QBC35DRAFT_504139 [Podospora australis]|uniref:Uncharacterized protein n=1 Tax=Podospora australis TaxID=1536484 RepID=A0AAN6WNS7_9PEZI|nr:hypothetical protein QBC35DRAFT_504139 [Podospora australis]
MENAPFGGGMGSKQTRYPLPSYYSPLRDRRLANIPPLTRHITRPRDNDRRSQDFPVSPSDSNGGKPPPPPNPIYEDPSSSSSSSNFSAHEEIIIPPYYNQANNQALGENLQQNVEAAFLNARAEEVRARRKAAILREKAELEFTALAKSMEAHAIREAARQYLVSSSSSDYSDQRKRADEDVLKEVKRRERAEQRRIMEEKEKKRRKEETEKLKLKEKEKEKRKGAEGRLRLKPRREGVHHAQLAKNNRQEVTGTDRIYPTELLSPRTVMPVLNSPTKMNENMALVRQGQQELGYAGWGLGIPLPPLPTWWSDENLKATTTIIDQLHLRQKRKKGEIVENNQRARRWQFTRDPKKGLDYLEGAWNETGAVWDPVTGAWNQTVGDDGFMRRNFRYRA